VIRTDERFGAGIPQPQAIRALVREALRPATRTGAVVVVQGFVGATADGRTTTLGRGGSDFTAALLGGALDAESVHIWTDVEGVLSGDPGAVADPHLLEELGFEEAVELSWSGARVLHPVAAKWAVSQGVPLRIRSTFEPHRPGTVIRNDVREAATVAAVTAKRGVALLKVRSHPWALPYGFLARVFEVLARHRLEVDLVATSHSSTAFTIDASEELDEVEAELGAFADVEIRTGLTTVTVVGRGLLAQPAENARVFATLEDTPIHLISQASDVSVALVVDDDRTDDVVARLHHTLVEDRIATGATVDPARSP
jgi:aspartate kinase